MVVVIVRHRGSGQNLDRIRHILAISLQFRRAALESRPMAARPLSRASRATAARARRVRCDGLEQKIARLWNTSPPPNAAARQVPPSTLNIFPPGSRCAAASAAVHGAAAALVSPRTPPTLASPRPHTTCALLSHPPRVCAARRSCSSRPVLVDRAAAARMQLAAM